MNSEFIKYSPPEFYSCVNFAEIRAPINLLSAQNDGGIFVRASLVAVSGGINMVVESRVTSSKL